MASPGVTQLNDAIVPEVFAPYVQVLTSQTSAFIQSGVLQDDSTLNSFLAGGGQTVNMPHWNDLDDTESNVSTDDVLGGDDSVPDEIIAGKEIAIRHSRNHSWSAVDLVSSLAGSDPMDAIASRVAAYWVRQLQTMTIASIQGVIADNIANDNNDMVVDITNGAGTVTAAHLFSAEGFLDTVQTMGDQGDNLGLVVMHSVVFRRAQKNNLIDFIPDARGEVDIPTFLGRRVVVDDGLPATPNNPNTEYSTYLLGVGALARGVGTARVPAEVEREGKAGRGGGQEFLYSRVEWGIHVRGTQFITVGMTDQSPTNTELRNAVHWDRVLERKQVRIAEFRTNG